MSKTRRAEVVIQGTAVDLDRAFAWANRQLDEWLSALAMQRMGRHFAMLDGDE